MRLEPEICVRLRNFDDEYSPYAIIIYILSFIEKEKDCILLYVQNLKSFPPNPSTGLPRVMLTPQQKKIDSDETGRHFVDLQQICVQTILLIDTGSYNIHEVVTLCSLHNL